MDIITQNAGFFRSIPVHFAAIPGQKSLATRHFSGAYPFKQ